MSNVILEDVNGKMVIIDDDEICKRMTERGFTLYGMELDAIREFRHQYMAKGGPVPITRKRVVEVFEA